MARNERSIVGLCLCTTSYSATENSDTGRCVATWWFRPEIATAPPDGAAERRLGPKLRGSVLLDQEFDVELSSSPTARGDEPFNALDLLLTVKLCRWPVTPGGCALV